MGQVPAATRALRVLRYLASQPEPTRSTRSCAPAGWRAARRTTCCGHDRRGLRRPPPRRAPLRPGRGGVRGGQRLTPARSHSSGSAVARSPSWSTAPNTAPTSPCCTVATCSTSSRNGRPAGRRSSPTSGYALPAPPDRERPRRAGGAARRPRCARSTRRPGVRRPARDRTAHAILLRSLLSDTRQRGYADRGRRSDAGLSSVAAPVLDHNATRWPGWPSRSPTATLRSSPMPCGGRPRRSAEDWAGWTGNDLGRNPMTSLARCAQGAALLGLLLATLGGSTFRPAPSAPGARAAEHLRPRVLRDLRHGDQRRPCAHPADDRGGPTEQPGAALHRHLPNGRHRQGDCGSPRSPQCWAPASAEGLHRHRALPSCRSGAYVAGSSAAAGCLRPGRGRLGVRRHLSRRLGAPALVALAPLIPGPEEDQAGHVRHQEHDRRRRRDDPMLT